MNSCDVPYGWLCAILSSKIMAFGVCQHFCYGSRYFYIAAMLPEQIVDVQLGLEIDRSLLVHLYLLAKGDMRHPSV
jgi:hypothetical protein